MREKRQISPGKFPGNTGVVKRNKGPEIYLQLAGNSYLGQAPATAERYQRCAQMCSILKCGPLASCRVSGWVGGPRPTFRLPPCGFNVGEGKLGLNPTVCNCLSVCLSVCLYLIVRLLFLMPPYPKDVRLTAQLDVCLSVSLRRK